MAEWTRSAEGPAVYLELRDDNYPGSNYTLIYDPERDALGGVYYQAVEGATYDVVFERLFAASTTKKETQYEADTCVDGGNPGGRARPDILQ